MNEDFELPSADYAFESGTYRQVRKRLQYELTLVARMIRAGFGTRLFYLSLSGFDTYSGQRSDQDSLLTQFRTAIGSFFGELQKLGDSKQVLLMTYSEFGRRVKENGSKGTDHCTSSCMFVVGPSVKGGDRRASQPSRRPARQRLFEIPH